MRGILFSAPLLQAMTLCITAEIEDIEDIEEKQMAKKQEILTGVAENGAHER